MKTLTSHGRKDQIRINIQIGDFAVEFFSLMNKRLNKSYIFHNEVTGNKLQFKGSIFRYVWNGFDLFNTISRGEVEFTSENDAPFIRHKIVFTEIFIACLLFNIIPLFTLKFEPFWSLMIFLFIWIVYTAAYLLTIYRFNSYITETLIKVNKTAGYEFRGKRK